MVRAWLAPQARVAEEAQRLAEEEADRIAAEEEAKKEVRAWQGWHAGALGGARGRRVGAWQPVAPCMHIQSRRAADWGRGVVGPWLQAEKARKKEAAKLKKEELRKQGKLLTGARSHLHAAGTPTIARARAGPKCNARTQQQTTSPVCLRHPLLQARPRRRRSAWRPSVRSCWHRCVPGTTFSGVLDLPAPGVGSGSNEIVLPCLCRYPTAPSSCSGC